MNYSVENPCSQTDFGLWDSLIQTQIMTPSQSACLLSTGGEGMQMRKQFPGWIIRHSSCERKKKILVAKLWESPKWHIQHSPHKSQSASCPVITLLLCPMALTLYCYPSSPSTWLYHSSGQASHVTLLTALWLSLFCRGVTADLYDPNNGLSSLFTIPLPLPPSALIPLDWKSPCDLPQCVAA